MRKLRIDLSKQLIIITLLSLFIMIISISIILPKALEPFFEQTVYSYLEQPLDMFGITSLDKKNSDVVYIIYKENLTYISNDYKKVLGVDDYTKLLKYINGKKGSFTYNSKKYYYIKKTNEKEDEIAITTDSYIKMLRRKEY